MRNRVDIGKVMVMLYEEYKKAEKNNLVNKPISYTLYHLWKYVDKIEKPRIKENKGTRTGIDT